MTGVGFLILFGLSCVLFSCEGQVYPPSNQNITFLPGSNATLKWTFVGDPAIASLAWFFTRRGGAKEDEIAAKYRTMAATINNSSLPGVAVETPATMILKNVDQRYNGRYRFSVQVAGGGGDAKVDVFIAVTPKVTINCPSSETVNEGDDITCVCRGEDGNPPANVTWYKDGVQIGGIGKEEQTLTLRNVNGTDTGTYKCVAQSHINATNETSIEIIVNYPPENVILTLRRNGDIVTITCNAEAHPAPSFKIFVNETKLIKSDKTYNIPKVNTSHVGNYSCVARNFLRSKTSNSDYLSLEEQRILLPPGGNILPVLSASTKKIEWSLYPRTPYPTNMYRSWTFKSSRGGKDEFLGEISRGGRIKIFTKLYEVDIKSPATLVLKNVNGSYNGTYEFTLESYSTVISKVEVFIAAEPNVTVNCSSSITLDEGDDLTCVGRSEVGNPPANLTWYKNGKQIGSASYGENSLTLTNVGKQDIATYKCVAQSYILTDEKSIEVKVTLNFKPEDTTVAIITESTVVGNSATITCSSKGRPEPWYNITHNDAMLVSTSETYRISETKWSDAGKYTCFAWNKVGNDSASVNLTLTVKPVSDSDSKPCGWWCILLIVIAVLVVLMIIAYVIYRYKQKEKDGGYRSSCFRGNADVSPGASGGLAENQYELDGEPSGGVDNTYDTVNNPGASGSKKKPPENTTPDVYAAVDKKNREGKPLYATLDSLALEQADNSKKKRDEERPGQTEYASIDFAKIGKADQE